MFFISETPINPQYYKEQFTKGCSGALVCFEGLVRNFNNEGEVTLLEYSCYQQMAGAIGNDIITKAITDFALEEVVCVHRIGKLKVGDMALWIGVSARHRKEAFNGCQYIIDALKAHVPIWKKEHYRDSEQHSWVANRESHPQ